MVFSQETFDSTSPQINLCKIAHKEHTWMVNKFPSNDLLCNYRKRTKIKNQLFMLHQTCVRIEKIPSIQNNTTNVLKFQVIPGSWDCDFLEEEADAPGLKCAQVIKVRKNGIE